MINDEFEENYQEYVYLDSKEALLREEALRLFFNEKNESIDMKFLDLDFYLKENQGDLRANRLLCKSLFDDNITLTSSQMEILSILDENNLFLSAPTSFGKTFIILEFIARHSELNNIVFIVPTLALMNELLKKIYHKFGNKYNLCINSNERISDKNIFIFVPERSDNNFISSIKNVGLDLLVIDEIYKLKPKDKSELNRDDRIILMNKVYLNLLSVAKKIVLLGPFIKKISFEQTKINIVKYYTNLCPVFNNVHIEKDKKWIDIIGGTNELVYFSSPESIYSVLDVIISKFPESEEYMKKYKNEINHLKEDIYENWYVISLLKRGIGVHHGKTPMFLRKFYENEYRDGILKCLLCTNTLMEGINTPTMRLLIVDNPGNPFQVNNLIGRVGRLNVNNPQAGDVFIFDEKTCEFYENRNRWESLTILAEDSKANSEDEILFLEKQAKDEKQLNTYNEKLSLIQNMTGKTTEELKDFDIKFNVAYKFGIDDYSDKFQSCSKMKDCVELACELLGKLSYKFLKESFIDINYPYKTLPYYIFITKMIIGYSLNEIINDFEKDNGDLSVENTNLLIDRLLELRTYIKFKLSKIINYFNLYNLDTSKNEKLDAFVKGLQRFNDLSQLYKIFEDLGIEENDYSKLEKYIPIKEKISTSDVIKALISNKGIINNLDLSPFTKRNINKL